MFGLRRGLLDQRANIVDPPRCNTCPQRAHWLRIPAALDPGPPARFLHRDERRGRRCRAGIADDLREPEVTFFRQGRWIGSLLSGALLCFGLTWAHVSVLG